MIDFTVSPSSAAELAAGFKAQRAWIIRGVLEGMAEAMQELAAATSEAAPHRTGALARAILASAKVKEKSKEIVGTVSGDVGSKHVGLWQEAGISVPETIATRGKAMVMVGSDGTPVYFRSHKAFKVPGRPFMNPTLQRQKAAIFEAIRSHVVKAMEQK